MKIIKDIILIKRIRTLQRNDSTKGQVTDNDDMKKTDIQTDCETDRKRKKKKKENRKTDRQKDRLTH